MKGKIVDNECADKEGTEIVLHANQIVTCAEELLKLVSELKMAQLLMDWKRQEAHVNAEVKRYDAREKQDRDKLKRVATEVKDLLREIDLHRGEFRAKRMRQVGP